MCSPSSTSQTHASTMAPMYSKSLERNSLRGRIHMAAPDGDAEENEEQRRPPRVSGLGSRGQRSCPLGGGLQEQDLGGFSQGSNDCGLQNIFSRQHVLKLLHRAGGEFSV